MYLFSQSRGLPHPAPIGGRRVKIFYAQRRLTELFTQYATVLQRNNEIRLNIPSYGVCSAYLLFLMCFMGFAA